MVLILTRFTADKLALRGVYKIFFYNLMVSPSLFARVLVTAKHAMLQKYYLRGEGKGGEAEFGCSVLQYFRRGRGGH